MLTEAEAVVLLRRAVRDAGGIREFSRIHSANAGNLSKILRGLKPMTQQFAETIGLRLTIAFVRGRK